MTRTPDETRKGLELCALSYAKCVSKCPYAGDDCVERLVTDALALIQQLEADKQQLEGMLTHMNQLRDAAAGRALKMEERAHQLEAERDAAVSELVGTCQVCRWEETAKCASCHFCEDAWNVHESNWEWRGVQKEG